MIGRSDAPRKANLSPARALAAVLSCAVAALGANLAIRPALAADSFLGSSGIAGFDHLKSAHIKFNIDGSFELPVKFLATSKGLSITADRANGNSKSQIMHAFGNVVVHQDASMKKGPDGKMTPQPPSTLTSDQLDVNNVSKLFTATGNMHFTQVGGRDATADTATLDDTSHHLHMQGSVKVHDKDRTIASNTLDYDTQSGQIGADGSVVATGTADSLSGSSNASSTSGVAGFDQIDTEHLDFNFKTGDFSLPVSFKADNSTTEITADHAVGNSKQKVLHADGHVVVHKGAEEHASGKAQVVTQKPSTLTSDKLDADGIAKMYVATGNVHFTQEGGREGTADSATLDDAKHHLHMQGNAHVKNGERTINANTIDYDTQTGQIDADGNVTITAPADTPPPGSRPVQAVKKKKIF